MPTYRQQRAKEFVGPASRVTQRFIESFNKRASYVEPTHVVLELATQHGLRGIRVEQIAGTDEIVLISFKFNVPFDAAEAKIHGLKKAVLEHLHKSALTGLRTAHGRRHYPSLTRRLKQVPSQ